MTTTLKTACPSCGKRLRMSESKQGKTVRCPACRETFVANDAVEASQMTIDTTAAAVSVDTTQLVKDETLSDLVSPSAQNTEEATLRKLGRFELKSVLGAGGFGVVYRAYDPQLERFVALKVPTFGPNQKTRIARFLAEAKAAARLKHANIVSTFETGKADRKYYIASEYIDGDLLSAMAKRERFNAKDAAQIVCKLAQAVAYAHSQGIVHRDIKPHNVMVDSSGEPQLMDFGLAKRTDDSANLTTDGALLGTPAYMAPEQARGELQLVNQFSDQYSLGVVLYSLLTGATPCEGSPHIVIAEVAKGEFHSVRDRDTNIDRTLDAICQKAMHPEQAQRYTDCDQFSEDLDAWANGKSVLARPLTPLQRVGRILVEHQVMVVLFSMIVVLSGLVAVFSFRLSQREAVMKNLQITDSDPARTASDGPEFASQGSSADSTADSPPSSQANYSNGSPASNVPAEIDLLSLVDVDDCHVLGTWTQSENYIECTNEIGATRIQIPYRISGEYNLSAIVEPLGERKSLAIGLCINQTSCHALLHYNGLNALESMGNESILGGPSSTTTLPKFTTGRRSTVRCEVRHAGVRVLVDGVEVINWKGDTTKLSQNGYWKMPFPDAFYVGTFRSAYRFHSIQLKPLTDQVGTAYILPPRLTTSKSLQAAAETFGHAVSEVNAIVAKLNRTLNTYDDNGVQTLDVDVHSTEVTDEQLLTIAKLTGPVQIQFSHGKYSGTEGFAAIGQMTNLRQIWFWNCQYVNEQILQAVAKCKTLRGISLSHQRMSDAEIDALCQISGLEELWIDGTGLTDSKIERVATALPRLTELVMGGNRESKDVTDAAVASLVGLQKLEVLDIRDTVGFTDECVPALVKMTTLRELNIGGTSITQTGFERLQAAIPTANIDWRPRKPEDNQTELDLLSVVNVAERTLEGQWSLVDGTLTSQYEANTKPTLEIPAQPPNEFTLIAEVTRTSASALGLHICFPFYSESTGIYIGGFYGTGIATIDGADYKSNKTSLRSYKPFVAGVTKIIEIRVKGKAIELRVDDETVLRFESNGETLGPGWTCEHPNWITLGCVSAEFRISKLTLIGHSGPIVVPRSTNVAANAVAEQVDVASAASVPPTAVSSAMDSAAGSTEDAAEDSIPASQVENAADTPTGLLMLTTFLRSDALRDVKVTVFDQDGNEFKTVSTDTRGRAAFRDVPFGDYEFLCQTESSGINLARRLARRELYRPTRGKLAIAKAQSTKRRIDLRPAREIRVEYAEVVPNADLVSLTTGNSRTGTITEAVTATCFFPLSGMSNRSQSSIRLESSSTDESLQLRCLPAGTIIDLGDVKFDNVAETTDEWTSAATVTLAAVHEDHVYLFQHQDGHRFKLRISQVN